MSADPHRVVYINEALKPLMRWLEDSQVVEISANGPGAVFVERFGQTYMERHELPALTESAIVHLAERVAAYTGQAVNIERPLLSAALPNGDRFQAVLAPATPTGGAFAIRKQVIQDMRLDQYRTRGSFDRVTVSTEESLSPTDEALCQALDAGRFEAFIRQAVAERYTILLSGGTNSGKTTFLNAILKEVPEAERILTIEDTREVKPIQLNHLPLLASKGEQGAARVSVEDLLQASLRLRPDRIFLGEIRGPEAYSFLRAVNTGHPGSITTVHADTPAGAWEQLALMVMQAGLGLRREEIISYIRSVVPIIIQLRKIGGWRGVTEIYFNKMPEWKAKNKS